MPPLPTIRDQHERWLEVDGISLRYLHQPCASARPSGPPLVFISGLIGYSFSWRHNLDELSRYANLYALDMPGTGFSQRPPNFPPTFQRLAEIVAAFCGRLDLAQFDLLGTSHGGAIAMMAAALPETHGLIRRLVLVSPVNPWSSGRAPLIRLLSTPAGAACARLASPLLLRAHAYFIRQVYGDPRRISPGTMEGYCAPIRLPGTVEQALRALRTWREDVAELRSALPRIRQIPALLLWGSEDRAILPGSAVPLAGNFDHAQVRIFQGAGHLPYEELPEEFNRAVAEFLYSDSASV